MTRHSIQLLWVKLGTINKGMNDWFLLSPCLWHACYLRHSSQARSPNCCILSLSEIHFLHLQFYPSSFKVWWITMLSIAWFNGVANLATICTHLFPWPLPPYLTSRLPVLNNLTFLIIKLTHAYGQVHCGIGLYWSNYSQRAWILVKFSDIFSDPCF